MKKGAGVDTAACFLSAKYRKHDGIRSACWDTHVDIISHVFLEDVSPHAPVFGLRPPVWFGAQVSLEGLVVYDEETYGSDTTFYVASSLDDRPETLPKLTEM